MSGPSDPDAHPPVPPVLGSLPALIAPLRFGIVAQLPDFSWKSSKQKQGSSKEAIQHLGTHSQALYRGSCPRQRHLPFLGRLRLKTILSLTPKPLEKLDSSMAEWATQHGIRMVHIHCDKPKGDGGGLSKEAAAKALPTIFDARSLPLYIHCLDGQSVSTLMVAIIRKVQAWAPAAIADEITRAVGHDEEILHYQINFVESFGKLDSIRLPPRRHLAEWSWCYPNPLCRLRDPYDVLVPKERSGQVALPHWPASTEAPVANNHTTHNHHVRQMSNEGSMASSAAPSPPLYGVGTLPVQHPTLKLRFDPDPDLPPPTSSLFHFHHTSPFQARENTSLLSPASSRPASRSGRPTSQTYAYGQQGGPLAAGNADVRAQTPSNASLAGSPRRKMRPADTLGNLDIRKGQHSEDHAALYGDYHSRASSAAPSAESSPRFEIGFVIPDPSRWLSTKGTGEQKNSYSTDSQATLPASESSPAQKTTQAEASSSCSTSSATAENSRREIDSAHDVFSTPVLAASKGTFPFDTPTPRATSQQRGPSHLAYELRLDDSDERSSTVRSALPLQSDDVFSAKGSVRTQSSAEMLPKLTRATSDSEIDHVACRERSAQSSVQAASSDRSQSHRGSQVGSEVYSDDESAVVGSPEANERKATLGGGTRERIHVSSHGSELSDADVSEEEPADEEEEEEEEEEEGDDESQQGSDLALEALDLEGY